MRHAELCVFHICVFQIWKLKDQRHKSRQVSVDTDVRMNGHEQSFTHGGTVKCQQVPIAAAKHAGRCWVEDSVRCYGFLNEVWDPSVARALPALYQFPPYLGALKRRCSSHL